MRNCCFYLDIISVYLLRLVGWCFVEAVLVLE